MKNDYDRYFFSGDEETFTTINNAAAVDATIAEVGLVTIPSTDHGFKAGAAELPTHIYVNGTVNYNGMRKIYAVATNTITIYAKYVAETFAGTETLRTMIKMDSSYELIGFEVHLSAASATAENLLVNKDSERGAAWDTNIYTKDMNTVQNIIRTFDDEIPVRLEADDKIDFTWTNTNDTLWGIEVMVRRVG
jgi:hypothetical protein